MRLVRLTLILLTIAAPSFAQTCTALVMSSNNTRAVIRVTAKNADGSPMDRSLVQMSVSTNSGAMSPLLDDVNATFFTGANLLNRATSVVYPGNSGVTDFFVGTRRVDQAIDGTGNRYSRALQVMTQYYAQANCNGTTSSVVSFNTGNIPLGQNLYPDNEPYLSGAIYQSSPCMPLDYSGAKPCTDPMSGVPTIPITQPVLGTGAYDSRSNQAVPFDYIVDRSSGTVGNPNNAIQNQTSNYATWNATGQTHALFLGWNWLYGDFRGAIQVGLDQLVDIALVVHGSGTAGTEVMYACISIDSGQTCASGIIQLPLSTSVANVQRPNYGGCPSGYPCPLFSGWSPTPSQVERLDNATMSNGTNINDFCGCSSGVSARATIISNSIVNATDTSTPLHTFNVPRAAGSKMKIVGSGCNGNDVCTVATWTGPTQFTISESATNVSNAKMQDMGSGILVWMGAGTQANVNFTLGNTRANPYTLSGNGGNFFPCSPIAMTDVAAPGGGNETASYGCAVGSPSQNILIYTPNPKSGNSSDIWRYISDGFTTLNGLNLSGQRITFSSSPWDGVDGHVIYGSDRNGRLYKGTILGANNATSLAPAVTLTTPQIETAPSPARITWTDITGGQTVDAQVAAGSAGTLYQNWMSWGLFPSFITGTAAVPAQLYGSTQYAAYPNQDGPCVIVRTQAGNNTVQQWFDSLTGAARWSGCHFNSFSLGSQTLLGFNALARQNTGVVFGGPWAMTTTRQLRNGTLNTTMNVNWTTVQSVSGSGPAVITTNVPHGMMDGDGLGVWFSVSQVQNAQWYAKNLSSTTIGVYSDAGLTTTVDSSLVAGAAAVFYGDQCPVNAPTVKFDGLGGYTNRVARCVTVEFDGPPCSAFAGTAEHTHYPCAKNGGTNFSQIQQIQPLDQLADPFTASGTFQGSEHFVVLTNPVTTTGNKFTVVLGRLWYTDPLSNSCSSNPVPTTSNTANHSSGFQVWMLPAYIAPTGGAVGFIDLNDPAATMQFADPCFTGTHFSFTYNSGTGHVGFVPGNPDPLTDEPFTSVLSRNLNMNMLFNKFPRWATTTGTTVALQSYPSQPGVTGFNARWSLDNHAALPASGPGQGSGLLLYTRTMTLVGGQTSTWKIGAFSTDTNPKVTPLVGVAGGVLLRDISGPGSSISDATPGTWCRTNNTNECVTGSAQGDLYVSQPYLWNDGNCWVNQHFWPSPCVFPVDYQSGWSIQQETLESPNIDAVGSRRRGLTMSHTPIGGHWTFQTSELTSDGLWGITPCFQCTGAGVVYGYKIPGWPGGAGVDGTGTGDDHQDPQRMGFRTVTISGCAKGGTYHRARFGYDENVTDGTSGHYYCTSRKEDCSTEIPASAPSDPFSYVSETPTRLSCATTINLPALPGRYVKWIHETLDATGKPIAAGELGWAKN